MEKVIKVSRERYASKRSVIEEKILRWSEIIDEDDRQNSSKKDNLMVKNNRSASRVNDSGIRFEAVCDNCGKQTTLNFNPDPTKPIYCKDCLKLRQEGKRLKAKYQDQKMPVNLNKTAIHSVPISLNQALTQKPQSFKGETAVVKLNDE